MDKNTKAILSKPAVLVGIALIFIGLLSIVSRLLGYSLGHFLWPFFIIVPGLLALYGGMKTSDSGSQALLIIGSIITITGVVLFFQTITGLWASWSYAWALVAPTGVGVGEWIYGNKTANEAKKASGKKVIWIGMILFLVGLIFFELILHVSGTGPGYLGVAIAFVVIGILFLVFSFMKPKKNN